LFARRPGLTGQIGRTKTGTLTLSAQVRAAPDVRLLQGRNGHGGASSVGSAVTVTTTVAVTVAVAVAAAVAVGVEDAVALEAGCVERGSSAGTMAVMVGPGSGTTVTVCVGERACTVSGTVTVAVAVEVAHMVVATEGPGAIGPADDPLGEGAVASRATPPALALVRGLVSTVPGEASCEWSHTESGVTVRKTSTEATRTVSDHTGHTDPRIPSPLHHGAVGGEDLERSIPARAWGA
jgi:hypothetical protein